MDKRIRSKLSHVREEISVAYANGLTLRELAKIHNVSPSTIRNLLISNDKPRRKPGRRKKQ